MATREAVQRWQSVLIDIEHYVTRPRGQEMRKHLNTPEARANFRIVNATPVFGAVHGTLTTPITDLRSVDPPTDPALLEVLRPVFDAALSFTPHKELLPQWDHFASVARAARLELDTEPMGESTVDEVIAEMLLSLKTTLLISGTGHLGSMKVIAEELIKRQLSFAAPVTLPLRFYDFATNAMVDHPSRTTLSLAAFKAIVNPDTSHTPVMKQFASQVIVDYYTNWEEYYRSELARLHDCSKYDFRIDYFGDLGKMRHDYVHNRGVCSNSAHCELLNWFSKGDLMIPTPENYLQLLTEFPAADLATKPSPVNTGRASVQGSASIPTLREFEKIARAQYPNLGPALDEALAEWVAKNKSAG